MYKLFGKRLLDIVFSLIGIIICLPLFIVVAILIKLDSKGPVFFSQKRMGRNGKLFYLVKFRTMISDPEHEKLMFEPGRKNRITRLGEFLRLAKVDEFPQLMNVLTGDMSFVGPRPEVIKYKKFYEGDNSFVLSVRPGIVDRASIKYRYEEDLLERSKDPEKLYNEVILPDKLKINIENINEGIGWVNDFAIVLNILVMLRYRRGISIFMHIAVIILTFLASFFLRFEFNIPAGELVRFYGAIIILIIVKPVVFGYTGLYRGIWSYTSFIDILQIIKANVFASLIFTVGVIILCGYGFPRSVFIFDFVLCTTVVGSLRFLARYLKEHYNHVHSNGNSKKVLIVGAGETGVMLLGEYRNNPGMGKVIGFIDDDRMKFDESIQGVKILGNRKDIPWITEKYEIEEIILAIPSVKGEKMRDLLSYCEKTSAKIKIAPELIKILSGKLVVKPKEIMAEDLLGRESIDIDTKEINSYLKNKVVLITGAGGSIGSEIARQIARFGPKEIILFDHYENFVYFLIVEFKMKYPEIHIKTVIGSIRDVGLLKQLFSKNKPEVIFHAAAHKHVPLMEDNPVAAVKNNIIGSRNLIYAANHYGVERFVLISTDKAVNPISIMGMSKRIAEMILQAKAKNSKTKFMAVRFGNVLGSSGSVVPLFKKQIEEGGPVTVTNPDVKRYFMSVTEAVMLVLQTGAMGKGGELFILDMGEQIKIVDIARNLIVLSGLTPDKDIEIKFIGLRPGEKLEEELLLDKEKDKATKNDKIFVSQPEDFDPVKLRKQIKRLERLTELMDDKGVVEEMKLIIDLTPLNYAKKIVPNYKPEEDKLTHKKIDILIADDEEIVQEVLCKFLDGRGYNTLLASNGKEALSIIDTNEVRLAFVDIRMPGFIDGLGTLKRIKKTNRNIDVIIMTGYGTEKARRKSRDLGACAYLEKPFDLADIKMNVEMALNKQECLV